MTTITDYQSQIQKILDEFIANRQQEKSSDPLDQDPPRNIRSFRQETSDTRVDTLQNARNAGILTPGKTRLNIISALTKDDRVDFFKFTVGKDGKLGASVTTDINVSFQVIKRNGTVIADSEAVFGEKAVNFEDLGAGNLKLDAGEYYIKITRATSESRDSRPNYALQLSMSRYYEQDYDTVETPAASGTAGLTSTRAQTSGAVSSLLNSLNGGNLFDFLL